MFRPVAGLMLVAALAAPAAATYTITPLSAGMNQRTVLWGQSFVLDIVITSDVADTHNSAIFQTRFTQPGLILTDYQWGSPYSTGDILDDSTPHESELPMPIVPSTLEGGLYPPGLTDLELSNVAIGASFSVGTIVSLSFTVPAAFGYTGPIFISLNPDEFAMGFTSVPTVGGQVFRLDVAEIPAPAGFAIAAIAAGSLARRRRPSLA